MNDIKAMNRAWAIEKAKNPHTAYNSWCRGYEAALAQPEQGEVVVTKNQQGQIVAVTRQDKDGRILKVIATSDKPDPFRIVCPTCSADRTKEACKGDLSNCWLRGQAHSAQPEQEPVEISRLKAMHDVCIAVSTRNAQPEQEPVLWKWAGDGWSYEKPIFPATPLYTAPPSKPDVNQELVEPQLHPKDVIKLALKAGFTKDAINVWLVSMEKLIAFAAPPSKQWVGLTEWERKYYNNRLSGSRVAEDIEFELRSRNEKN